MEQGASMKPPIKIHYCLNGQEHILPLSQNEGESDEDYDMRCHQAVDDVLERGERSCTLT
jgi:hypothetical protein